MVRVLVSGARGPGSVAGLSSVFSLPRHNVVGKKMRTCRSKIIRCQHTQIEIRLTLVVLPGVKTGKINSQVQKLSYTWNLWHCSSVNF